MVERGIFEELCAMVVSTGRIECRCFECSVRFKKKTKEKRKGNSFLTQSKVLANAAFCVDFADWRKCLLFKSSALHRTPLRI